MNFFCFVSAVEWSSYQDFLPLSGEAIVEDIRHLEYEIRGLMKGNVYYVRVAACNIKGLGGYTVSTPPYAVPSSELQTFLIAFKCYIWHYQVWTISSAKHIQTEGLCF